MNISKTKIAFYLLTFQKSKIPEYLLDVGNNWVVNCVSNSTKDNIKDALEIGDNILSFLSRYKWLCPEKWRSAYELTVSAFADVIYVCKDLKLTVEELDNITKSFKIAYAEWCAD